MTAEAQPPDEVEVCSGASTGLGPFPVHYQYRQVTALTSNSRPSPFFWISRQPLTRLVPLFWLVEVSVLIKSDVKNRTGKVAQWVKCLLHTHEILSSNSQHPCKRMDGTLLS